MSNTIAEPKCPDCKIQGAKYITCCETEVQSRGGEPWFEVAHCSQCGHVYGVFAKIVKSPTTPSIPLPNF